MQSPFSLSAFAISSNLTRTQLSKTAPGKDVVFTMGVLTVSRATGQPSPQKDSRRSVRHRASLTDSLHVLKHFILYWDIAD